MSKLGVSFAIINHASVFRSLLPGGISPGAPRRMNKLSISECV